MLLEKITKQDIDSKKDEEVLALSITHPASFEVLVERYQTAFLRKARSVLHDEELARDIVQETFTKIYLAAPRFKEIPGASFKSWGYKILMNTSFSYYRKRKRDFEHTTRLEEEQYESLSDARDPLEELEQVAFVSAVLTRVPSHLARVLRMHFLDGLSHQEIAEREKTTPGAIKTRVYRAKKVFRDVSSMTI